MSEAIRTILQNFGAAIWSHTDMRPTVEKLDEATQALADHVNDRENAGYERGSQDAAVSNLASDAEWTRREDDAVRNGYINALLTTVPPTADSGSAAKFVWDTCARLMEYRAKGQGTIPVEPNPSIEERAASLVLPTAAELAKDMGADVPFPVTGASLPPAHAEFVQPTWGGGAKFGDGTVAAAPGPVEGSPDDGPF